MHLVVKKILFLSLLYFPYQTHSSFFDALDDSILHKIVWTGGNSPPADQLEIAEDTLDSIIMTTARNEKYRCKIPVKNDLSNNENSPYMGPNPFELLAPLFTQFVCTFKLETFWTYELCHGKYIRQYHEEREGKKVKLQEYFLGRWDQNDLENIKLKMEESWQSTQPGTEYRKVDGVAMPYLQVNMTDGTVCDLNGKVRTTRVLYVCYAHGKHEIYSLEEVSTCEYEIVVLSPLLCQHPDFKSKESGENLISCHPEGDSPKIPKALAELETESFKIRHEQLLQNLESLFESKVKGDVKPVVEIVQEEEKEEKLKKPPKPNNYDSTFLIDFLEGKSCLTGGSHWWKFELCYGKHVLQYHEEEGSPTRTEIMLGRWDEEAHKAHLEKHPHKKSLSMTTKKTVYHFYTNGDSCGETGNTRSVEVKLKCVEHSSPSAIAVYLLEPKTCEYALGVESSLLCPFIKLADDYGIIDPYFNEKINDQENSEDLNDED